GHPRLKASPQLEKATKGNRPFVFLRDFVPSWLISKKAWMPGTSRGMTKEMMRDPARPKIA
ncbi:MAG TPA: hypothetical protein VGG27_11355, partial [Magnetospirillaceae bacterium]